MVSSGPGIPGPHRVRRVPPPAGPTPDGTFQRSAAPKTLADVWTPKYESFGPPAMMYPAKGSGYEPSGCTGYSGAGRHLGGVAEERAQQRQALRFTLMVWTIMAGLALTAFLSSLLTKL